MTTESNSEWATAAAREIDDYYAEAVLGDRDNSEETRNPEVAAIILKHFPQPEVSSEAAPLLELRDWLLNEGEKLVGQALSRRGSAKSMRGTSAEDLRAGKRLAEKMMGHKCNLVSTDPKDNERDCSIQERIADKLEAEGRRLCAWADELASVLQLGGYRVALGRLAAASSCECDHSDDDCCVKVGHPCAVCELAALDAVRGKK